MAMQCVGKKWLMPSFIHIRVIGYQVRILAMELPFSLQAGTEVKMGPSRILNLFH